MIKFSIIVPVYNVSTYLSQCIESIICQTYQNLEIICIDDGSTDASGEILDNYAQQDKRIKVIHKKNTGYGDTINLGISMANGDYVGIVESDDYIALNMYQNFAEIVTASDYEQPELIKSSFYKVSKYECVQQELFDIEMCGRVIHPQEYARLFWIPCSIWSAVYQKDFLTQHNIRCLETPGASYQDTSFWFKALSAAKTMILTNESLYFYRVDNMGSSINSGMKVFCVCDEIKEIERFMTKHKLATPFLEGVKNSYIYKTYIWNYYRLHNALKSAFWVEMCKEFTKIQQSPRFEKCYWKDDDWNNISDFLADPERFFLCSVPEMKKLNLDQYTSKELVYSESIQAYLSRQNNIVIYGAGVYGRQVWKYIKNQEWNDRVIGFAVTKHSEQFEKIDGKRVYEIEELVKDKDMITVIVAVKETSQLAILKYLRVLQFTNVLRVDDVFWKQMRLCL